MKARALDKEFLEIITGSCTLPPAPPPLPLPAANPFYKPGDISMNPGYDDAYIGGGDDTTRGGGGAGGRWQRPAHKCGLQHCRR